MTNTEALLSVVASLPGTFSQEELILAAWRAHPQRFGIKGHLDHPDSHVVLSMLCGSRGLVGQGYLERTGPRMYRSLHTPQECVKCEPKPVAFTTNGLDSPSRHDNPEPGKALNPAVEESGPNLDEMSDWLAGKRHRAVLKMCKRTGLRALECHRAFVPGAGVTGMQRGAT